VELDFEFNDLGAEMMLSDDYSLLACIQGAGSLKQCKFDIRWVLAIKYYHFK
jgi:hypothetical protein